MNIKDKLWYKVLNTKIRVSIENPKILRVDQMREVGSLEGIPNILKLFGYRIYAVATLEEHSTPRYFVISRLKLKKDYLYFYADFPGRLDLDKEWQVVIVDKIYQPYKLVQKIGTKNSNKFKCVGSFSSYEEARQFTIDSELFQDIGDYYYIRKYYTELNPADYFKNKSEYIGLYLDCN